MKEKMIIISIDALGSKDLMEKLDDLPTLKELVKSGSHVQNVQAIYPSLTYPSHTTIMTGVHPKQHGIVNNTKIQPQRVSPDWFWYAKDIQSKTIFDAAIEEGRTVSAFLWPVTAKSRIHWNIAEIFPNRIWTNQVLISMQASTPRFLYEMNKKYGHLRRGIKQPELDDFVAACAIDTIQTKQPDLTLIHLVDLDSMRHQYGVESKEAHLALQRQDARVAEIIEATKNAGTFEDTIFVILGDHYQIDVNHMIRLNALFSKLGWLTPLKNKGFKKEAEIFAKTCDGSTYLYQSKNSNLSIQTIVQELSNVEGIENIYTREEIREFGADDQAILMLEAKRGYYFQDESIGEIVEKVAPHEIGSPHRYKAVHGFSPLKENYETTILFYGKNIKANNVIPTAHLIDEAPTFAKLLKLKTFPQESLPGRAIEGILIQEEDNG